VPLRTSASLNFTMLDPPLLTLPAQAPAKQSACCSV